MSPKQAQQRFNQGKGDLVWEELMELLHTDRQAGRSIGRPVGMKEGRSRQVGMQTDMPFCRQVDIQVYRKADRQTDT